MDQFTASELRSLNLIPQVEAGGVTFTSSLEGLYRANLHLRTASRILARVGQFFYATTFSELRDRAGRLPWERFIKPGQAVAIRATCHKSKLMHTGAVAERIASAIYDRLGKAPLIVDADGEEEIPAQLVVIRIASDRVIASVDSSGELLHRRGYRQAVARAPIRETLAAGMLMAAGWDGHSALVDPFCGSGTIPIEAAMMSAGIPPGLRRRFAFMDWPDYDEKLWHSLIAGEHLLPVGQPGVFASDRDAGAIQMSQANAARAGVADAIQFSCNAISAVEPPAASGWIVTNPPYGLRISEGRDLRNLYAQLGNVLRARFSGWHVAILCSDPILLGHTGLKLDTSFSMINGGVSVRLGIGSVI